MSHCNISLTDLVLNLQNLVDILKGVQVLGATTAGSAKLPSVLKVG